MTQLKVFLIFAPALLIFQLVTAKSTMFHKEAPRMSEKIQLLMAKKVFKAIQDLNNFQNKLDTEAVDFIRTKSFEVLKVLPALPKQCSQELREHTKLQQNEALKRLSECSGREIVGNAIKLGLETVELGAEISVDGTLVLSNLIACVSSTAHLTFNRAVFCVFKVFSIFPEEVKEIINGLENYTKAIDVLLPEIVQEIKSCYSSSTNSFQLVLNAITNDMNTCNKTTKYV